MCITHKYMHKYMHAYTHAYTGLYICTHTLVYTYTLCVRVRERERGGGEGERIKEASKKEIPSTVTKSATSPPLRKGTDPRLESPRGSCGRASSALGSSPRISAERERPVDAARPPALVTRGEARGAVGGPAQSLPSDKVFLLCMYEYIFTPLATPLRLWEREGKEGAGEKNGKSLWVKCKYDFNLSGNY